MGAKSGLAPRRRGDGRVEAPPYGAGFLIRSISAGNLSSRHPERVAPDVATGTQNKEGRR